MNTQRFNISGEKGFALIYMTGVLTVLLLFTGLAVDAGRAYVVKAQLSKAVDGAALGAARMLNAGDPRGEAARIFKANFPDGYMGTGGADPTAAGNFFGVQTVAASGVNIVTVTATTELPTTFMKLANMDKVTISSMGEAQRRMVDLSLVLDVSSSIGSGWAAVRDASRAFVNSFDRNGDRVALVTYSNGSRVIDPMPSSRGFDKTRVMADIPNSLPGGSTAMVQGLYRGWDEVRSVPRGQQSGLRVIVLFTDGASNSVPGVYPGASDSRGLRTYDFPKVYPDPDGQTWDTPTIAGLYDTETGAASGGYNAQVPVTDATTSPFASLPYMPQASFHSEHRSSGIPTTFPLQSPSLTVNGASQQSRRGLRHFNAAANLYPITLYNVNNAARNLVEIIANEARNDASGDYKIRIYTIGMG
ncbi:MAG: VWA domain-containing protein, partial [Burkholderiales bacterium]